MLIAAHILWGVVAIILFRTVPPRQAFWAALIGGWLLLPPAAYGPLPPPGSFTFTIVGSGLPSAQLVTKQWTAPAIALLASALFDRARWGGLALRWWDLPIAGFCLWPLLQGAFVGSASPAPPVASLYLLGAWGLPWLAGKLYLRGRDDARAFAGLLAGLTLLLLPFALIEGLTRFRIQTLIYGANPFAHDGIERYIGFRPQLFFEHGNQYGLWIAGAALAAAWRWRDAAGEGAAARWRVAAVLLAAATLAAQSAGAIILLAAGLGLLFMPRLFGTLRIALPMALAGALAVGALHVSGAVPLRSIATDTAPGKAIVGALRASGRGSATWRVSQDLKTLPLLRRDIIWGTGRWDWFRPAGTRPWGLPLLILGAYGLVGLALLGAAFGGALVRLAVIARSGGPNAAGARLAILLLLLSAIDALFNSFLFYPAIAGAALSGGTPKDAAPDRTPAA
ncbi:hypothetical protein [Sphingopyxis sp. GC21]|uniref:hypothetical protein n=1 Tax=Sphingopyxis sp. GC21 TaxID=2933562 RepID=UPI0021E38304|nr:hypothetical protein [Sphingopyxis sp. GC21]